jgi:hypothetical protein
MRLPVLAGGIGDDGEEKTQVIRLTPDPGADADGTTEVRSPGERTQVIAADHGEKTQVISLPERPTEAIDGDRTQVIRLGVGTVEPPGDRTQVLKIPAADARETPARKVPGEQTTASQEPPTKPSSIVGEERPNPGEDPTTRIVPPTRPGDEPTGQPGEETTVDVGGSKRAMTATSLERPADEADDDTRRLAAPPVPAQRQPSSDEA